MDIARHDRIDLLATVGSTLLVSHHVERVIRSALLMVLREEPLEQTTVKGLADEDDALSGHTLGTLMKLLRKRVTLSPEFQTRLERFKANRDALVHQPERLGSWDFNSPDGRSATRAMLHEIMDDGDFLIRAFEALIQQWAVTVGLKNLGDPSLVDPAPAYKAFIFKEAGQ